MSSFARKRPAVQIRSPPLTENPSPARVFDYGPPPKGAGRLLFGCHLVASPGGFIRPPSRSTTSDSTPSIRWP